MNSSNLKKSKKRKIFHVKLYLKNTLHFIHHTFYCTGTWVDRARDSITEKRKQFYINHKHLEEIEQSPFSLGLCSWCSIFNETATCYN